MLLIRRVNDGEMMPWCWGVAWYDYCHRQTALAPIPINFAIRVFWWMYWGVAVTWVGSNCLKRLMAEMDAPYAKQRARTQAERSVAMQLLADVSGLTSKDVEQAVARQLSSNNE